MWTQAKPWNISNHASQLHILHVFSSFWATDSAVYSQKVQSTKWLLQFYDLRLFGKKPAPNKQVFFTAHQVLDCFLGVSWQFVMSKQSESQICSSSLQTASPACWETGGLCGGGAGRGNKCGGGAIALCCLLSRAPLPLFINYLISEWN